MTTASRSLAMLLAGSAVAFWALTSTLDGMTRRDCQAGVPAACAALNR